jgi:hypothetical protein
MEFPNAHNLPQIPDFSKMDYYARLGVRRNVGAQELKEAFRELSLKFHPDRHPDATGMTAAFQYLSEAYTTLKDPVQRERYNARLNYDEVSETLKRGAPTNSTPKTVHPTWGPTHAKKEVPTLLEVKQNAIRMAHLGASYYGEYIKKKAAEGCPETASIIHMEIIQEIIRKSALLKAQIGPEFFGPYIAGWVDNGYDKSIIANNPDFLKILKQAAIDKIQIDHTFYSTYVEGWLKFAKINIAGIIKTAEAHAIIEEKLLAQLAISPYYLGIALAKWTRVGFDKTKFMSSPILKASIKNRLLHQKINGEYFYNKYRSELLSAGIDLSRIE